MKNNIIVGISNIDEINKFKKAGANSIILGIPFFSVRSSIKLSFDELNEAIKLCHDNQMNAYVLINRFFVENELGELRKCLNQLKTMDVDGIYFTDMAVYYEAKQLNMQHLLMYNPDTILTNSMDVNAYLNLGLKACTISKEITLEDMLEIGDKCQKELEVFIHGRLNMLHSKRNLLTNYMNFIKKDTQVRNRNDLYLIEEHRSDHMPIIEDEHGTHIFTGYTLCSFKEVNNLVNHHIHNLRIERLFESSDEICQVIKDYVAVLNNEKDGEIVENQYLNRDDNHNFTTGFMYKKTGLLK